MKSRAVVFLAALSVVVNGGAAWAFVLAGIVLAIELATWAA